MNIFEDKTAMVLSGDRMVVRTTMVPAECRDSTASFINNRLFENSDVQNVMRPRIGHSQEPK